MTDWELLESPWVKVVVIVSVALFVMLSILMVMCTVCDGCCIYEWLRERNKKGREGENQIKTNGNKNGDIIWFSPSLLHLRVVKGEEQEEQRRGEPD